MAFERDDNSNGDDPYRPLAEINVTPLVDVMLVLLIIFMVTAPLIATGLKVNLPTAHTAQTLTPKPPIVVTVEKNGALSIGADAVGLENLTSAVRARLGDGPDEIVRLRGDRDVSLGRMVEVMDRLVAGGVSRVAIVAATSDAVTRRESSN